MSVPAVDPAQIALFLDVVFSWCDGLIPLRGLPDKGVTPPSPSDLRWLPADGGAAATIAGCAEAAAPIGRAIYVIPGTVAQRGEARAEHVVQMQALVVDLDEGDMVFGSEAQVDPESGEVLSTGKPVVASHYKSPANGLCMELDDPCNWPDPEDDHA
ncbi:hypothetical protein PE067_00330 [Paracoccus sp. DMF-8]|uniref:hypothetical protein n=1 Tax=Paracoccus sp. DMF-8 TaxID=3019445 RepID=UPI0023E8275A|nr:hypothetical protein [Paracoccus sp. DMF-8]MDF3604736.1 hypothetical protein [Paracoccus sp. DMF-8]